MYTQVNSWPWSSMKPYFCQDSCITGSHYTLQVHLHLKVDNFLGLSRQAQDICLCQSTARGKGKRMICTCWWPHLTWSASAVLLQSTSFLGQVQQPHKYNLPHLLLTPNLWSCSIWPRREAIWRRTGACKTRCWSWSGRMWLAADHFLPLSSCIWLAEMGVTWKTQRSVRKIFIIFIFIFIE